MGEIIQKIRARLTEIRENIKSKRAEIVAEAVEMLTEGFDDDLVFEELRDRYVDSVPLFVEKADQAVDFEKVIPWHRWPDPRGGRRTADRSTPAHVCCRCYAPGECHWADVWRRSAKGAACGDRASSHGGHRHRRTQSTQRARRQQWRRRLGHERRNLMVTLILLSLIFPSTAWATQKMQIDPNTLGALLAALLTTLGGGGYYLKRQKDGTATGATS